MEKELKIDVPEGYEIDKENSTFECIRFKKKKDVKWRNSGQPVKGYWIDDNAEICKVIADLPNNYQCHSNVFSTRQQAKSALAMAQISQIMANDPRFGGPITDEEWGELNFDKCIIYRYGGNIFYCNTISREYCLLAFHTEEQRDLFMKENEDLVKDYLMID